MKTLLNAYVGVVAPAILLLAVPTLASAQVITGIALYEEHCSMCHSSPAAGSRAPDRQALGQLTPEVILEAITIVVERALSLPICRGAARDAGITNARSVGSARERRPHLASNSLRKTWWWSRRR